MAEIAVSFLVERLGDLVIQKAQFLYGVPDQVGHLKDELERMRSFLRDADAKQEGDERVRNWVREIRDLAFDAEDVIDTFTLVHLKSNPKHGIMNSCCRMFSNCGKRLTTFCSVGSKISDIKSRISNLTASMQNHGIHELPPERRDPLTKLRRTYSRVDERNIVGLEENANKLAAVLVQKGQRVVSICGMGGLGKTTLAKKVYHRPDVQHHFNEHRIWVCISQQYRPPRDIWEDILLKIDPDALGKKEDTEKTKKSDAEIAGLLFRKLKSKRCLVVLDDIWDTDTWPSLSPAFPIGDEDTETKYLLTSRNKDVALHADPQGFLHEPSLLDQFLSFELFRKIAIFARVRDHPDTRKFITEESMTNLGKVMVAHCKGLPLAIIVLAGILATKDYIDDWEQVDETIKSQLRCGRDEQRLPTVLGLSYDDLPYYLKPCFLHLGQFPEDYTIPTRRVINWWVAEAIIPPETSRGIGENEETLEDIAYRYLTELTDRYLVQVDKRSPTGRIKSCRIHDHIRDMCIEKAKKNDFFQILELRDRSTDMDFFSSPMMYEPKSRRSIRRVSLYLNNFSGIIPLGRGEFPPIRYAVGFGLDMISGLHQSLIESMVKSFKMLRVLDLEDIQGFAIPKAIGGLIHLRVLTLNSAWIGVLSESLGNLRFLLTLSLDPYTSATKIPNVIWKMKKLRHLYLPTDCGSDTGDLKFVNLKDLQTLRNFPASKSDVNDLTTLTNLRKLVIQIPDASSFIRLLGIFQPEVRFNHLHSLAIIGPLWNLDLESKDLESIQSCCLRLKKLKLNQRRLFPTVVDSFDSS